MSNYNRILFLDIQNETFKNLEQVLDAYELNWQVDYNSAIDALQKENFDICLISCEFPDIDQLIPRIKIDFSLPILLIAYENIQDTLKNQAPFFKISALSNEYGKKLLQQHTSSEIKNHINEKRQETDLNEVTTALLTLQSDNAKLQDINRFLQHSFFCLDISALCEQFFSVTKSFGTKATLYIHSDKHNFFISDGPEKKLNHDLLKMLEDESRIYQFGNNRAVFNWSCASLLVNKLGSDVDNLAMLMDGFEIGFNAIESVEEFNQVLKSYQIDNKQLNTNVATIVEELAMKINQQLSFFGSETSLTLEQEDALMKVAEDSRNNIDELFKGNVKIDEQLSTVMKEMRTKKEAESSSTVEDDSIQFF